MSQAQRKVRVVIADDSVVYRTQIRNALSAIEGIEVVGVAANGKLAIDRLITTPADLLILDLEMPEMNGLQTLQEMKVKRLTPKVLLFSSHSKRGAEVTMDALKAGASDFVTKPGADVGSGQVGDPAKVIRDLIQPRIEALFPNFVVSSPPSLKSIGTSGSAAGIATNSAKIAKPTPPVQYPAILWDAFRPLVVVFGSSTGGPTALEEIFALLSGPIACPILIAQHMPPLFTATLAERLQKRCGLEVKEGVHGEKVLSGRVYVAPGDFHMSIQPSKESDGVPVIEIDKNPPEHFVRPAVDPLFRSAAQFYKSRCLGIVLTGMGADGRDGAVAIKKEGGAVVIQEEKSCVVFGMPGAVQSVGAFDRVATPIEIAELLMNKVSLRLQGPETTSKAVGGV